MINMDRNESANDGGSSPDTIIARSSSEDDPKKQLANTSGEYVTVGESSSSLDTVTSIGGGGGSGGNPVTVSGSTTEEKKRGRFGALKSSFRKEGSLFKIKKKRTLSNEASIDVELEDNEKEVAPKKSQQPKEDEPHKTPSNQGTGLTSSLNKKQVSKKKKSHSLVRKLSLNKFRISSEQEPRHTPEGGDSSRSQSQSSQESPVHLDSVNKGGSRGQEEERVVDERKIGRRASDADALSRKRERERERERDERAETRKSENLHEKPFSTVTVVQRKSPSLTIKTVPRNTQPELEEKSNEAIFEKCTRSPEVRCFSTLPYAISKWSEADAESQATSTKKRYSSKSESFSSTRKSSPVEVQRKLSLLEEKRAIFQRRYFDSTKTTLSHDTVIAADHSEASTSQPKKANVSVKTFDTFSSFDGTFDESTGVGYLTGVDDDNSDSLEWQNEKYVIAAMGPMVGTSEDKGRPGSQESASSQNNTPNAGVGEKREHLYKILVIGELGAGKTSIIKRYVHQFFSQHYRATIGVDFALKVLNWDPHTIIRLQLWDIAGQERFGNMTRVYYKEAVGAFIVFDVTRSATLDAVVKWKQDLDSKVQLPDGSPIPCVLLANKCDQQKEGLVNSPSKMDEYCKEKNFAGWFETSAKENINIEEAARFLVNKILQNDQIMKGNASQDQVDGERFALNQSPTNSKKSCTC